jgi:DNA-binding response OmpR family regulator
MLGSRPLVLTRKEYELLTPLLENAGTTVPRQTLLERLWGYDNEIRSHTLKTHIHNLRRELG